MRTDLVLKRPLITEKTMQLAQLGKFSFEVNKRATKQMIAKAIEDHFNVEVVDVSTTVLKGKMKRFGAKRKAVKATDSKKAIVELKQGQKIDLFEIKEEK